MDLRSPLNAPPAWALAPLPVVVASAALGWGLGLLGGSSLGALTVPAGFCAGIALMTLCLTIGFSGKLTVAVAAVCAVGALVLATVRLRRRGGLRRAGRVRLRDPSLAWPGSAALFAYAIALAPVAGSGHSGVLGYVLNNDPSVHITLIEALVDGPAHPSQLQADSFHHTTAEFAYGYPLGSLPWPLFARVLTGIPAFHLWSPLSALVLALMALVAYDLLRTLEMPRPGAAAAGALVALGHLVYAYHVQGGTKEILLPLTVYATAALTARAFASELGWRSLAPAAVAAAAVLADIGYVGIVWLGPPGLLALIVVGWRARRSGSYRELKALGAFAAIALAVALPIALRSVDFFKGASSLIANPAAIGNLYLPIGLNRTLNVWLAHDYRFATADAPFFSAVGIWLAGAMAVAGCVYALRRRNLGIALALVAGWAGVAIVTPRASIYFGAKTLVVLTRGRHGDRRRRAVALQVGPGGQDRRTGGGRAARGARDRLRRVRLLGCLGHAALPLRGAEPDRRPLSRAGPDPRRRAGALRHVSAARRAPGSSTASASRCSCSEPARPFRALRTPDAYVFSHIRASRSCSSASSRRGAARRRTSGWTTRRRTTTSTGGSGRRRGRTCRSEGWEGGAATVRCTHGFPRAPAVRARWRRRAGFTRRFGCSSTTRGSPPPWSPATSCCSSRPACRLPRAWRQ